MGTLEEVRQLGLYDAKNLSAIACVRAVHFYCLVTIRIDSGRKLRSELTERSFAHLYATGGMRRVHMREGDGWRHAPAATGACL